MNPSINTTVLHIGKPTDSGFVYTREVADIIVKQAHKLVANEKLLGWPPIPDGENESWRQAISNASHVIRGVWIINNELRATIEPLGNQHGCSLFELIKAGHGVFGLRVYGRLETGSMYVSKNGLRLLAIDVLDL